MWQRGGTGWGGRVQLKPELPGVRKELHGWGVLQGPNVRLPPAGLGAPEEGTTPGTDPRKTPRSSVPSAASTGSPVPGRQTEMGWGQPRRDGAARGTPRKPHLGLLGCRDTPDPSLQPSGLLLVSPVENWSLSQGTRSRRGGPLRLAASLGPEWGHGEVGGSTGSQDGVSTQQGCPLLPGSEGFR